MESVNILVGGNLRIVSRNKVLFKPTFLFHKWREVSLKVKMKRCINCKTLLSNSSKACTKCGSYELENGIFADESNNSIIFNKHLNEPKTVIQCPICCAPVTIKLFIGECHFCGEEVSINGSSY